jgi:glutamine---fructose-6-phosphate transaminase (isomerizing)
MIEPSFPVFVFTPVGVTWTGLRELIRKVQHLHADLTLITDKGNREAAALHSRSIVLPVALKEFYTPIPYIIPAQLFAAYLAAEKGLNPDQPRTLSKVTRTL